MSVSPVAVQAGKTSECEVAARYSLHGAYQVFVTGTGVTGTVEKAAPKPGEKPSSAKPTQDKLKVRFQVAPDALPGPREVRVATPQGVSTVGQIVVVCDPVVIETANNDTAQTATPVKLPASLCGAVERLEDVDFYKFTATAGTSLTFHVQCQRLQNKIHDLQVHADPILTVRNAAGAVLASNDNHYAGDPLLHVRFPAAGDYFLEVRDVRYGGNPYWQYCVEVSDRPYVTAVYPPRLTPGVSARVRLVGHNPPADAAANLVLPPDTAEGLRWEVLQVNGRPTNAVPFVVSRLPEVNEAAGDNDTAPNAQKVPFPVGIGGRLDAPDDIDCYAFEAKKGDRLTFAVVARDAGSPLDAHLRILNAKGEKVIENDDFRDRWMHADSAIENWAAPADSRYAVEVRDVHGRGGPEFVYFLKAERAVPHFLLEADTDKTLLGPGTSGVVFVRIVRKNGFTGPVQLGIDGLPAGVTARCGRILDKDGCIILQAAPDAKLAAANVRITGTAAPTEGTKPSAPLTAVARPLQEIYMPGGGRYHFPVETHAVSVNDPTDLRGVRISPAAVTLKPGETKKIDVTIDRAPGFQGNVTLEGFFQHLGAVYGNSLPPGVSVVDDKASVVLLSGQQSKGTIVLKAAPDAKPVEKQQVAVMANVSINFVMKFTYAAEPLLVTVVKP